MDGIYRRCGLAPKVTRLVEALQSRPDSAPMEDDEQGILDVGSALKRYVRQQPPLLPPKQREFWVKAAGEQLTLKLMLLELLTSLYYLLRVLLLLSLKVLLLVVRM